MSAPAPPKPEEITWSDPGFQPYSGEGYNPTLVENQNYTGPQYTATTVDPSQYATQYQQWGPYANALTQLQGMATATPAENTALTAAQNYMSRVNDPNYSTYSQDEMDRMYQSQGKKLDEAIQGESRALGTRLANSGLAGSGLAQKDWLSQSEKNIGRRSDIWENIQKENRDLTRQDRNMVAQMTPQLASLQMQAAQQPYQNLMAWAGLASEENTNQNQWNQTNQTNALNTSMWNAGQQNQAGQFNAEQAYNQWQQQQNTNMWNAGQQNQAGQFNTQLGFDQWGAQNAYNQWASEMGLNTQMANNQNYWQWVNMAMQQQQNQQQQWADLMPF